MDNANQVKTAMKSLLKRGVYPSRRALSRELGKKSLSFNNELERKVWIEHLEELGYSCNSIEIDNNSSLVDLSTNDLVKNMFDYLSSLL